MKTTADTKKIVYTALCLSAALVLSYVEALIPVNLGVPGAKLGLPNVVTVLLLYTAGWQSACLVAVMRIVLSGFLFGNLFAILYSAAGFFLSFLTMLLLKKTDRFGITGVSVAGGVMHNVGQLAAAALITNASVFAYLPVLVAAGTAAGVLIGLIGAELAGRLADRFRDAFS